MSVFIWVALVLGAVMCAYAVLWYASAGNVLSKERNPEMRVSSSPCSPSEKGGRGEWRQRADKYFRLAEEREKRARLSLDPELKAKFLIAS